MSPVLEVEELTVSLGGATVVRGVSFTVDRGELLGIVGESGSGKSMTLRGISSLVPPGVRAEVGGRALLDGEDLLAEPPARARARATRAIGFVFQDPLSSLNPGFRIGWQMREALRYRAPGRGRREADRVGREMLSRLGLPDVERIARSYPHELSGGMRQRVMIAMALAAEPRVLFADEPTTALDVTLSADILDLLDGLRREHELATVLVSHDLGLVLQRCDRVLVMHDGTVVESGRASEVLSAPRHPYTRSLLAATVDPFARTPALAESR